MGEPHEEAGLHVLTWTAAQVAQPFFLKTCVGGHRQGQWGISNN